MVMVVLDNETRLQQVLLSVVTQISAGDALGGIIGRNTVVALPRCKLTATIHYLSVTQD